MLKNGKVSVYFTEVVTYSLYAKESDWKVEPKEILEQNGWWHLLTFQINTTALYGKLMYIYSKSTQFTQQISATLNTQDVKNFPLSSFPLEKDLAKMIYVVRSFGTSKTEVQTNLHVTRKCCKNAAFSFGVTTISRPGILTKYLYLNLLS